MLGRYHLRWLNSQSQYIELESLALSFRIFVKKLEIEWLTFKLFLFSGL